MNTRRRTPFQHLVASAMTVGGHPGGRKIREAQETDLEVRNQGDGYEIHLISQEAHSWAHSKLHDHPDIEADFKSGDTIQLDDEHAAEAVKLAKAAGLKVDGEVKESRRNPRRVSEDHNTYDKASRMVREAKEPTAKDYEQVAYAILYVSLENDASIDGVVEAAVGALEDEFPDYQEDHLMEIGSALSKLTKDFKGKAGKWASKI